MKKIITLVCLLSLSAMSFAQEEKKDSKTTSPEVAALQTAASLAKYGYDTQSPTALIEAAKIISETPSQEFTATATHSTQQTVADKDKAVSFDPAQLLADAKKFAGKDKVILAYAAQVEKNLGKTQTRGAVGSAKYGDGTVYGNCSVSYTIKFWANELAEVAVVGDGRTDIDLYIYDENGNLVASDADYSASCLCRWVPAWTGNFTIKIVNRGSSYSYYAIATN